MNATPEVAKQGVFSSIFSLHIAQLEMKIAIFLAERKAHLPLTESDRRYWVKGYNCHKVWTKTACQRLGAASCSASFILCMNKIVIGISKYSNQGNSIPW